MTQKRVVICHYHIFKNSGSTFDALLQRNYGNRHVSFDGPFPYFIIEQDQLETIIVRHPDAIAFSSHQVRLPVPSSLAILVLPVIFIRHPLLRARSIYHFIQKSTDNSTMLSETAHALTFDQWVGNALSNIALVGHISNAQTGVLSGIYQRRRLKRRVGLAMEYDVHQAIRNIENVYLLGRTEYFDDDVRKFSNILGQYDIEFKHEKIKPENVTSGDLDKSLDERIDHVRKSLSEENFTNLMKANSQDLSLFDHVSQLIEARNK